MGPSLEISVVYYERSLFYEAHLWLLSVESVYISERTAHARERLRG